MISKMKADNTAMRGDKNGVHRAAVQLEPGDVWYDINAPSIYILLSTSPWTFLIVDGGRLEPVLWSPQLLPGEGESYIRTLFSDVVFVPGRDQ
jgi:hypothetical protein